MVKIPLVPQWNLNSGCVCTPDGGFLYAGARSINFISYVESSNEEPIIKCFHTRQGILSLDVDPYWSQKQGGNEDTDANENLVNNTVDDGKERVSAKLFVALLQDNSVQIWDFNKGCAVQGHKAHLAYMRYMEGPTQNAGEVLISYMCNRNVLSMDKQDIVVYCVASNSFYRRPIFISPRNHQLTFLKCSPYNENHFAVGTKRGLVLLCDLHDMTILYTLRGHDTAITSLSWNRINLSDVVGDKIITELIKTKIAENQQSKPMKLIRSDATIDSDEIFDIYDYDYLNNEFGASTQEIRLKHDLVSEFVGIEKTQESSTNAKFDFTEACQSLKEEIHALRGEQPQTSTEYLITSDECRAMARNQDDSSACSNDTEDGNNNISDNESSNDSIVRLECRTSSEGSVDVDGMCQKLQQHVICQADVHQPEEIKSGDIHETHSVEIEASLLVKDKGEQLKCSKPKDTYDFLLASSSADCSFCVWNVTTGANCDTHKVRSSHGGKNFHIEISWISPTSLIINNRAGQLQMWSVQPVQSNQMSAPSGFRPYKFKENKRVWNQRSVTSFACSAKNLLWTISSHREVCLEDVSRSKILLNYSCVSTNIGAIEECPDDMNKIALGFSDRRIGVIDISKMTPTSIHIENFVQRIESNVMSLVWSPDCKKLAYGTMEGRIGVINTEGSNRQSYTYNSICGKPIYSISWQDKFLYIVCNESIAVFEDDPAKKDAYIIPNIGSVACVSIRNNYLFVGTQSGQLRLYTRTEGSNFKYELKTSMDLVARYITEISWSPIATNKLAVVANANIIHILEFNSETADLHIKRKIEINSVKAANGCVKWSNRNENCFLTCGFDGAVRVWDLSRDKNPERFVKTYHCPMTCGLFLPTDEEILICSGKSAAFEFIDMRVEKTEISTGKSKRSNARSLDTVQWATKAVTRDDAKTQTSGQKGNRRRLSKAPASNAEHKIAGDSGFENGVVSSVDVSMMLDKMHLQKSEVSIYMKNPLTLMYLTTKEINKDALDLMFSILSSPKPNGHKSLSAKLFGTRDEAKQLLAEEFKNHQKSEGKGISSLFMSQLNNSLKDEILKCVQSKELCEWHVSLAPSISYGFWRKCCEAYAQQLVEQGYAIQAAAYMLAMHQHQAAIEMLLEKKFYKEASLIARIYLQKEDPLNNTISDQWITHLHANGNLTGAALICLLTKQNNRAYECLVKIRNTVPEIERVIRLLKSSDI